ncbi:MAG TPA: hypothetical protein VGW12_07380 [Pyrinomonadaceae bacterium]|nr:hypothetical protein [Pyrinomonadaceae bacterium]
MFCPTCGAAEQRPDAYCTRCGEWLADPTAAQGHWHPVFRRARTPEQRMKMMLVFNTLDALLAVASAAILYATQAGAEHPSARIYLVATFCVVIATHQIVSLVVNLKIQQRLKRAREDKGGRAARAGETNAGAQALNPADVNLFVGARRGGGVTENTTKLLDAVPRKPEQRQTR